MHVCIHLCAYVSTLSCPGLVATRIQESNAKQRETTATTLPTWYPGSEGFLGLPLKPSEKKFLNILPLKPKKGTYEMSQGPTELRIESLALDSGFNARSFGFRVSGFRV